MATWISSLLMLIGGALVGELNSTDPSLPVVVTGLSLFVTGFTIENWYRSRPADLVTFRGRKAEAERREVLILFLSPAGPIPDFVQLTGNLDNDLAALAETKRQASLQDEHARPPFWSWEQPLRGIHHNFRDDGPLRRVVLIGSKQTVPMIQTFYREVISRYPDLVERVQFQTWLRSDYSLKTLTADDVPSSEQNGFDFEDFDEVTIALNRLLEEVMGEPLPSPQERTVQIDITGGQKPTSVVAAAVTLFNRVSNQYVATSPADPTAEVWQFPVWGYDAVNRG